MVKFNYITQKGRPKEIGMLKAFIPVIFKKEKTKLASLNYIFCDDDYLLNINKNFLGHNYYTDIITFCYSSKGEPVTGEVYISTDRVLENSTSFNVPYREEIQRVIFHGALHLCGFKDKTKADSLKMRAVEERYLRLFNKLISRGTVSM